MKRTHTNPFESIPFTPGRSLMCGTVSDMIFPLDGEVLYQTIKKAGGDWVSETNRKITWGEKTRCGED